MLAAMALWDGLLSADEQFVFDTFRRPKPLGKRPAVIIVDVNYAFVGLKPATIVESVKDYSTSCGERGWQAIGSIRRLITAAREHRVPLVYTTGLNDTRAGAHWAKRAREDEQRRVLSEAEFEHRRVGNRIVEEI